MYILNNDMWYLVIQLTHCTLDTSRKANYLNSAVFYSVLNSNFRYCTFHYYLYLVTFNFIIFYAALLTGVGQGYTNGSKFIHSI